jgi:quercetin dioxygenase-like cupin family protein
MDAVIETPDTDQTAAWWFLDNLVVEHASLPGVETVVLEMTLPAGSSAPLHVHADVDDTWFVLAGEMLIRCGDDESTIGPGAWVSLPRGVPHTYLVLGDEPARILVVHDNDHFRAFIRDLSVPAAARVLPPNPKIPSPEALAQAGAAHALTPIGPPLTATNTAF